MLEPIRAFFRYLRFREPRPFCRWVQEEMLITEGAGAGMLFRPRGWQALVLPELQERPHLWLATPPRAGKTLLAVAVALYHALERGAAVQLAAPTAELASEFWFQKLMPVVLQNRRLRALVAFDPSLRTLRGVYRFRTGGSIRPIFNPKQIRSYDASVLVATEAATFAPTADESDALTLLQKRQDDWPGQGVQFFESTHRDDLGRFAREVAQGTDSRIECRCVKCRKWFEAGARETFVWTVDGEDCEPHVRCPECGAKYPEKRRARLLKHLRLVARRPAAPDVSITVNWLHTRRSMAELAALEKQYKETAAVPVLRDLLQNWYGVPTRKSEELQTIASTAKVERAGLLEHRTGPARDTLPAATECTIGAIDVQKDWLYCLLAAYETDGTLALVHWSTVKILQTELQHQGLVASPERVLAALDAARERLSKWNPAAIWCDVSYKSEASQAPLVADWAARQPGLYKVRGRVERQIAAMKAAPLPPALAGLMRPYRSADGTIDMFLNTTQLKNQLSAQMLRPADAAQGFRLPRDLDPAAGDCAALLLHLTSEEPLARKDGSVQWAKRFGHTGRNDWWDCLTYAYAGALYQHHLVAPWQAGAQARAAAREASPAARRAPNGGVAIHRRPQWGAW